MSHQQNNQQENKIFAVKKQPKNEFWAVIDCGITRTGGMTYGTFWQTHFKHEGRTYRWYMKLFNSPASLQEWQEITIHVQEVCILAEDKHNYFEGWEDEIDLAYSTLRSFAKMLGKELTIQEVKELIDKNNG